MGLKDLMGSRCYKSRGLYNLAALSRGLEGIAGKITGK